MTVGKTTGQLVGSGHAASLADIPESECTSLVRQLLEIIRLQQERIQQLERVTNSKTRSPVSKASESKPGPQIAPSVLETPSRPPPAPNAKRPGSANSPRLPN